MSDTKPMRAQNPESGKHARVENGPELEVKTEETVEAEKTQVCDSAAQAEYVEALNACETVRRKRDEANRDYDNKYDLYEAKLQHRNRWLALAIVASAILVAALVAGFMSAFEGAALLAAVAVIGFVAALVVLPSTGKRKASTATLDQPSTKPRWQQLAVIAIAMVLGLVLTGVALGNVSLFKQGLPACGAAIAGFFGGGTSEATTEVTEEDLAGVQEDLTVSLDGLLLDQYSDVSWELLKYSLSPYDAERTQRTGVSDAVSLPFEASNTSAMFEELEEEILRNPVVGIGYAEFLSDISVGDKTVADLNTWMADGIAKNDAEGVNYWVTYADSSKTTINVTEEYRLFAAGVCSILERLVVAGTGEYITTENWCLPLTALNSERKLEQSIYEYQGTFLVLEYVTKDGNVLVSIGFNTLDKRPALITELVEEEDGTVTVTPSSTTTTVTPPSGGGSSGGDDDETYTKDPTQDPAAQGNAEDLGGKNDNAGAGEYSEEHSSTATGSSSTTGDNSNAGSSTTGSNQDTAPSTDPIEKTDSTPATDNATGESTDVSKSDNNTSITMPD